MTKAKRNAAERPHSVYLHYVGTHPSSYGFSMTPKALAAVLVALKHSTWLTIEESGVTHTIRTRDVTHVVAHDRARRDRYDRVILAKHVRGES